MEQFRAVQVANEIRDEDHAGDAEVEVLGTIQQPSFYTLLSMYYIKSFRSILRQHAKVF